jgi:hypothetical protein
MSLQISHQAVAGPPTKKLKTVFGEKGTGHSNRDINNQNWELSEVKEVPGSNPRQVVGEYFQALLKDGCCWLTVIKVKILSLRPIHREILLFHR